MGSRMVPPQPNAAYGRSQEESAYYQRRRQVDVFLAGAKGTVFRIQFGLQAPQHCGACGSTKELEVLVGLGVSASTLSAFSSGPTNLHGVGWGGSCTPTEYIRSNPPVK